MYKNSPGENLFTLVKVKVYPLREQLMGMLGYPSCPQGQLHWWPQSTEWDSPGLHCRSHRAARGAKRQPAEAEVPQVARDIHKGPYKLLGVSDSNQARTPYTDSESNSILGPQFTDEETEPGFWWIVYYRVKY
jgi:hypothetical protein